MNGNSQLGPRLKAFSIETVNWKLDMLPDCLIAEVRREQNRGKVKK